MRLVVEAIGVKTGGGVGVALSLLRRLAQHGGHRVVALVPDVPEYKEVAGCVHRVVRFPVGANLLGRHFLLNRTVPRICKRENADVLLCLGNFPPRVPPCPTVVLLQNAWIVMRDRVAEGRLTLREGLIIRYGRRCYRSLPDGVHIVTQTAVMRERLRDQFGVDPREVSVIPNGISLPAVRRRAPKGRAGKFTFLCLARYYAHKNIEILLDAVEGMPPDVRRRIRCLLTISPEQHPGAARVLRQLGKRRLKDTVVNLGPVDSARLVDVYGGADALVFPTLVESHSRTYLEAMHFGLPVLTSDLDFTHNACQDAAVYFDPLDAKSVAKAMARVMEDADLRAQLVENGKRIVAKSPTWDEITARFVDVLERVAAGSPIPEAAPHVDTTLARVGGVLR